MWPPPPYGIAEGATQVQPSGWSGGSCFHMPSELTPRWGGSSLPLRPVWPSWIAGTAPMRSMILQTRVCPSI